MTENERAEWLSNAKPIMLDSAELDTPLFLKPKVFSSGSVGWYLSTKVTVSDTLCQVGFCLTVVGTKRTPDNAQVQQVPPEGEKAPETPQKLFEANKASRPAKRRPNDS